MRYAYHVGTLEQALSLAVAGESLALELVASHEALNFANTHALTLLRLQRFADAILEFERVRADAERLFAPGVYFGSSNNLMLTYTRVGAFDLAMAIVPEIERYVKSLDLPLNGDFELIVGLIHAYAGRGTEARNCFETIIERLSPSGDFYFRASALHGLALACTLEGKFEEAEHHARAELEMSRRATEPDWVLGQTVLAFAVARQGRLEEALELSDEALAALPEDARFELPCEPVPWINAQLHHALGHDKQARAALERAHAILQRTADVLPEAYRAQYLEAFRFNREIRAAINGRWSDLLTML